MRRRPPAIPAASAAAGLGGRTAGVVVQPLHKTAAGGASWAAAKAARGTATAKELGGRAAGLSATVALSLGIPAGSTIHNDIKGNSDRQSSRGPTAGGIVSASTWAATRAGK